MATAVLYLVSCISVSCISSINPNLKGEPNHDQSIHHPCPGGFERGFAGGAGFGTYLRGVGAPAFGAAHRARFHRRQAHDRQRLGSGEIPRGHCGAFGGGGTKSGIALGHDPQGAPHHSGFRCGGGTVGAVLRGDRASTVGASGTARLRGCAASGRGGGVPRGAAAGCGGVSEQYLTSRERRVAGTGFGW